jgi:hypothetical protein
MTKITCKHACMPCVTTVIVEKVDIKLLVRLTALMCYGLITTLITYYLIHCPCIVYIG